MKMRSISTVTRLCTVVFLIASQQSVADDSEEAAIKAVNEKQMAAYVGRDYDGEAEVWAQEPYIAHAGRNPPTVGWEKLSASYRTSFAPESEPSVVFHAMTASNYDIHLNGNVAFVFFDRHREYTVDGERKTDDGKSLKYFEKKNGQWRIIAIIPLRE
jgi:ketosteroid isomerase-like protein